MWLAVELRGACCASSGGLCEDRRARWALRGCEAWSAGFPILAATGADGRRLAAGALACCY